MAAMMMFHVPDDASLLAAFGEVALARRLRYCARSADGGPALRLPQERKTLA